MDKYQTAEANRQRILDALNGKPMTLWQLVCKLDDDYMDDERCAQLLQRMEALDEVSRTMTGISRRGQKCALWSACVETTISSDDIMRHITGNLKGGTGRKARRSRPVAKPMPAMRLFGGLG